MGKHLNWPQELAWQGSEQDLNWNDGQHNCALDFHGDLQRARLVVFSDGNHHMALQDCVQAFLLAYPQVDDIFYLTLPPGLYSRILESGALRMGNLRLSMQAHVLIGPDIALQGWLDKGRLNNMKPFAHSLGNVLLVCQGNPKAVQGVADLYRGDVRIFISNPETEKASYEVYRDTLLALAEVSGLDKQALEQRLAHSGNGVMHGQNIHHRELPQALASDRVDVAPLYYHLALRYLAVFPGQFEMVSLPGAGDSQSVSEQVTTEYYIGVLDGGGDFGEMFVQFMQTAQAAAIYTRHGLAV